MIELYSHEVKDRSEGSFKVLRSELSRLAMRNVAFRRGDDDFQQIELTFGDRRHSGSSDPFRARSTTSEQMFFQAVRNRSLTMRPRINYEFAYHSHIDGIELPAHIAMDAYGGESVTEAVAEAGASYAKQSIEFTYDSLGGRLTGCESVTYLDRDDTEVAFACLCGADCHEGMYGGLTAHYTPVDDSEEGEEGDGFEYEDEYGLDDIPEVARYQFDQDAARLREFIIDDKERSQAATTRLGREIDDQVKARMVRMAIATTRTIYDKVNAL